ncbi:MAG: hypothetical protein C4534_05730 [Gaiellales bacterium]|nr:MAG: hypothetical protein C4534_05730 [Gaiellales bacterium]
MVISQHGEKGGACLRNILQFLKSLYELIAPEAITGRLTVFQAVNDKDILPRQEAIALSSLDDISQRITSSCIIQVLETGYLLWQTNAYDPQVVAQNAVVYLIENSKEAFYAKDERMEIEKLDPSYASNFALPTFDELREALENYRSRMIRHSTCEIFKEAWFDANRICLAIKPEKLIRRSLAQYLASYMRGDVEVRPEQIVDETHPIDIKVTWWRSRRLALIEIKWLGASRNASGITTTYTEARARDGADQLVDYLNKNKSKAPVHQTRGYLVVVDARRAKVENKTKQISVANGMYYANKEIGYNPEHHKNRDDFDPPVRMFAEPICN